MDAWYLQFDGVPDSPGPFRALDQRFTPKIAIGATPAELQKPTATTYIRPIALTWQVEVTGWDPVYGNVGVILDHVPLITQLHPRLPVSPSPRLPVSPPASCAVLCLAAMLVPMLIGC